MAKQTPDPAQDELGNEAFMSAADLRAYMSKMQMAQAMSSIEKMDSAEKARQALVKSLSEPIDVTPERIKEVKSSLLIRMKKAIAEGKSEFMVMRFPNSLCTDSGRAINNNESGWPDTLTGRPRQAYEFWRDDLKGVGYRLKAMIIDWHGGMPGDVGFFLDWADQRA